MLKRIAAHTVAGKVGAEGWEGRLVWTRVHREYFRDYPEKFDFRDPGKVFVVEYANFIAHKNEKLGSAGSLPDVWKMLK